MFYNEKFFITLFFYMRIIRTGTTGSSNNIKKLRKWCVLKYVWGEDRRRELFHQWAYFS